MATRNKEEKLRQTAEVVAQLVAVGGVAGLTHARVARKAGVSRPWVYRYVGGKREDLLTHAVRYFGVMFTDLKTPMPCPSKEEWLGELDRGFLNLFGYAERYPGVLIIYFQYRGSPTILGSQLDEIVRAHAERERIELTRTFGMPEAKALLVSSVLAGARIGLAHEWALGGARAKFSREEFTAQFRTVMAGLV